MAYKTNTLETLGYHIERNLLSKQLLDVMNIYFSMKEEVSGDRALITDDESLGNPTDPQQIHKDLQVRGSMTIHGDFIVESLLSYLTPVFSEIAGTPLVPTYAFFRYYNKGQKLDYHWDRICCEFSATVPIGYSEIWPIWLKDFKDENKSVDLELGDILFYKGCAVPHWREPFEGEWAHQTFLHWVSIETANSHPGVIFDGRKHLGLKRNSQ